MDTTSLFDAIIEHLESLQEHLVGGIYRSSKVAQIHFSSTPGAYDENRELLPCLLLNDNEAVIPDNGVKNARRVFFSLIFHERLGLGLVRDISALAYTMLRDWTPELVALKAWPIEWASTLPSVEGPNSKAPTVRTITSRYVAYIKE